MKRQKSPFKAFVQTVFEHPARLLEWTIFGLVAFLLLRVGYAYGGSFEFGFGLAAAVPLVYAILSVFALWTFFTHAALRLPKGPLWSLPFVVWIQLQSHFLAKGEWISEGYASGLLMAWVVYFVITTALRRRVFLFSLLLTLAAVVVYLGAFSLGVVKWHALTPEINDWLQGQSRSVVAPFGHPSAGAFAYLIGIPLAVVIAGLPRFAGFVRMGAASIAVIAIGFVGLGGTVTGIVAVLVVALYTPFFMRPEFGQRLRLIAIGLVALLAFEGVFFVGFYPVRTAIEEQLEEQSSAIEPSRWLVSVHSFFENPLVGSGMGTSPIEAQKYASIPSGSDSWESRSTPLELLAETGIIGGILAVVALVGTFGRLFMAWKREPFHPVDKEAAYRNSMGPGESKRRRSRSKSKSEKKRLKRSTTKKVLLGGIVASLLLALLYSIFESAWSSLLSWLLLAILLGMGERFTEEKSQRAVSRAGLKFHRYAFGLGSCLCAFLIIRSIGTHYARAEVVRAEVGLQIYRDKPFLAFENPGQVTEVRRLLSYALDWEPDNGDALALKAESFLMEEFVAQMTLVEAGARALESSIAALALYPDNGFFVHLETNAKALSGAPEVEVEAGYKRAAELMPNSARVLTDWANYRIRDLRKPEAARELVERVLDKDPSNEKALELLSRINL